MLRIIYNNGLSRKLSVAVLLLVATLCVVIGLALWQIKVENLRQESQIRGPVANAQLAQQVDLALTRLSRSASDLLVATTDEEKAAAAAELARERAQLPPLREELAARIAARQMLADVEWPDFILAVDQYLMVLDEAESLSRQNSKTHAALLSAGEGARAFQRMSGAIANIREVLEDNPAAGSPAIIAQLLEVTLKAQFLLTDILRLQKEIVAELNADNIDTLAQTIEQRARAVRPLRSQILVLPLPAIEQSMQEFQKAFTDWVRINRVIRDLAIANTNGKARQLLTTQGHENLLQAQRAVHKLVVTATAELEVSRERAQQDFEATQAWLVGTALAGVIVALTLFSVMVRTQILLPLGRLRGAMIDLARGDLQTVIQGTDRADEIGAMARTVLVFKKNAVALAESEARYRDLLENLIEGVYQLDARGRLLSANIAFARMLGYATSEDALADAANATGRFYADADAHGRLVALLEERDAVRDFETTFRRIDGARLFVTLTARAVREDGALLRIEGTAADITARLEVQAALHALNADLEHRVRERTSELEDTLRNLQLAQDELVRSEKLAGLGALVAGIAHEINTPIGNSVTVVTTLLTKIEQFRQLVQSGNLRRSEINLFLGDLQEAGDLLQYGLQTSAELIGNFKRVAVDQASDHRRSFDCGRVTDEVLSTLRPMAKHRSIRFEAEIPEGLVFDSFPGAYGQIITNLVANAIMHGFDTRSYGRIRITVAGAVDPASGWVTIEFADDGHGIPPDILSKVFDPFFTTRLGSGGSGLGLHIVYSLVTRVLGGRITVKSVVGQGTRFLMTLPFVAPQPDSAKSGT